MATSLRGKEKRGQTPSSSIIKKNSSSSSADSNEKTRSPTPSTKPIPNYLRPTISSSLESKKLGTDNSSSRPSYTRRRSFDKPPPTTQLQKAVRAPTIGGARDIKPVRSSSFSNKSTERLYARTSSLKNGSNKAEQPQLSKCRSLKKTTLSSMSSSSSKKSAKSVNSESSVDCDENRSSVDRLVIKDNDDELVNINDDDQVLSLPEISEMPDSNEELGDPDLTNLQVEEVKHIAEEYNTDHDVHKSIVVDRVAEAESGKVESDGEAPGERNLIDEADEKAPQTDSPETLVEEKGEPETKTQDETQTVSSLRAETAAVTESETKDETQTVSSLPAETETKDETQTVGIPPAETAAITGTAAVKTTQASSAGKKDKQDYNDVIEETATKLMGKKNRNKVLALAGAFETVISLQDTNKS
ncbi:cell wall protein RBR3-like [Amaranthus tricolor]|uniref:cell wall protein RBR3-like n=1 Tax=Amaranthus tricolor TaxID=29722 RepID=UPI0025872A73|nr:cell wall protein RBR3-like [Amaranthus tricolor]